MADRAHLQRQVQDLAAQGKLIESGWVSLRLAALPDDAPAAQLRTMRQIFFAGAQHLYGSIMASLDPGQDATDGDLDRMAKIHAELEAFGDALIRDLPTQGNA